MIVVVDYGRGNIFSLSHALSHIGVDHRVSKAPKDVDRAKLIVLPGVGAFGDAMSALKDLHLINPIREAAKRNIPLLGICLGMQILASKSEEFGDNDGLDIIPGKVRALPPPNPNISNHVRIPNVGWRNINVSINDPLLNKLPDNKVSYFVHSYGFFPNSKDSIVATTHVNGIDVPSIVRKGKIVGCQFHPEKSGDLGLELLKNFFLNL